MGFNFDQPIARRGTGSAKWELYAEDVLPMWVADMDFASPPAVLEALHERIDHGVFGYAMGDKELSDVICARMQELYNWTVTPDQIVYLPGLVSGINVTCRAFGAAGDHVLTTTPSYPPFLSAPGNHGQQINTFELTLHTEGQTIRYSLDHAGFAAAITPQTKLLLLSHPHNPVGLNYTEADLRAMAAACIDKGVVIVSDEIHCDLMLGASKHQPMASLDPAIAAQTITLMAPSKTFNVPGLGCSFAIVTNPELKAKLLKAEMGIVPHVNALGYVAAKAAYQHGGEWLSELMTYIEGNRDLYVSYIHEHMPQLRCTVPDATYLGWIDCRGLNLSESPYQFFLREAKVAFSDGATFGPGGAGFVRINLGTTRAQLQETLERMRAAIARLNS
jgi:cysteine-S-conjugate beta-lyase